MMTDILHQLESIKIHENTQNIQKNTPEDK